MLKNPWVLAFLIGVITVTAIRPFLRFEPDPPPVQFELPAYSLIDQDGQPFGSEQLEGKVYIASFFFTNCVSICPVLTQKMAMLQQRYDEAGVEGIELVSISVDPDADTPEVMREYGERFARTERWHMLTGELTTIKQLLVEGFKVAVGDKESLGEDLDGLNVYDIAHSAKFVIVDQQGRTRGHYDTDEMGLDEIFHRSQHVLRDAN